MPQVPIGTADIEQPVKKTETDYAPLVGGVSGGLAGVNTTVQEPVQPDANEFNTQADQYQNATKDQVITPESETLIKRKFHPGQTQEEWENAGEAKWKKYQANQWLFSRFNAYIMGGAYESVVNHTPPTWDSKGYPTNSTAITQDDYNWWVQHPDWMAQHMQSTISEQSHDALVANAPSVYRWIAQRDTFAGIPGALSPLRMAVLNIRDPRERKFAMRYVDGLADLPMHEQKFMVSSMAQSLGESPEQFLDNTLSQAVVSMAQAEVPRPQALTPSQSAHFALGNDADYNHGQEFTYEDGSPKPWNDLSEDDKSKAIRYGLTAPGQMYAGANAPVGAAVETWASNRDARAITEPLWVKLLGFAGAAGVIAAPEAALSAAQFAAVGALLPAAGQAARAAEKSSLASGTIDDIIGRTLGGMTPFGPDAYNSVGSDAQQALHSINDFVGAEARRAQRYATDSANWLGQGASTVITGATGGSVKLTPTQKNLLGNILLIAILHEAGTSLGAAKTSMGNFDFAARGELGIGQDLSETYKNVFGEEMNPVRKAWTSLTHPLGTGLDPAVRFATNRALGYFFKRDYASVITNLFEGNGIFGKWTPGLFNGMENIRESVLGAEGVTSEALANMSKEDADKVVAAWREAYGSPLPQDLAERLARIPRDQMGGETLIHFENLDPERIRTVKGSLGSTNAHISNVNSDIQDIETKLHSNMSEGVSPEDFARDNGVVYVSPEEVQSYLEANGAAARELNELRTRETLTTPDPEALKQSLIENGWTADEPLQLSRGTAEPDANAVLAEGTNRLFLAREAGLDRIPITAGTDDSAYQWIKQHFPDAVEPRELPEPIPKFRATVRMNIVDQNGINISRMVTYSDVSESKAASGLNITVKNLENRGYVAEGSMSVEDITPPRNPELFKQLQDKASQLVDLQTRQQIQTALVKELEDNLSEPVWRIPGRSTLPEFLHRALYRPTGPLDETIRMILNPLRYVKKAINWSNEMLTGMAPELDEEGNLIRPRGWLNENAQPALSKLTDKLDNRPMVAFADPSLSPVQRQIIENKNLEILNRFFKKLGMSDEDNLKAKSLLMGAKSQDEWFAALGGGPNAVPGESIFGDKGLVARYLPDNLTPEVRRGILNISNRDMRLTMFTTGTTDANGLASHTPMLWGKVVDGTAQELPSIPSQFVYQMPLPLSDVEEALSTMRRWRMNIGDVKMSEDPLKAAVAWVYDFGKGVMQGATALGKTSTLLFNIPAIILTKELDEGLGSRLDPSIMRGWYTPSDAVDYFTRIPPELTARTLRTAFYMGDAETTAVEGNAATIMRRGYLENDEAGGLAKKLIEAHKDPLMRLLAQNNYDVASTLAMLTDTTAEGYDASLAQYWERQQLPMLERASAERGLEITPEEHLSNVISAIRRTTFDHPEYEDFVRYGRIGGSAKLSALSDYDSERYTQISGDVDTIREKLGSLDPIRDRARIGAYQLQLENKLDEMSLLEEQSGMTQDEILNSKKLDLKTQRKLTRDIKDKFVSNEIKLPDTFSYGVSSTPGLGAVSLPDHIGAWARGFSDYMYSHNFPLIGVSEGRFAKGSFFSQKFSQFARGYIDAGWSKEDALELANVKAVDATRDIFYDLTARSTVEKQFRNIFWFAPVTGELMYRWLYAIPGKLGGLMPGALLLQAKANAWYAALKDAGVITKDPNTGQEVFGVSGIANWLVNTLHIPIKLPGIEEMPLASFNPHLFRPVPEASPLFSLGLNQLARYSPVIKDISNIIAPQSDMQIMPASVRNALSIWGVKTPDGLSTEYEKIQWARTHDQAIQFAYTDLEKRGIFAPTLAQFGLDANENPITIDPNNLEKSQAAIAKAESDYRKAWSIWFSRLMSDADHYSSGIYALKTISSVLLPGYIVATSPEQQQYDMFFKSKVLPQIQAGDDSSMVNSTIDNFLGHHPDSLAYSVSYNYTTGQPLGSTITMTDDQYYDKLVKDGAKIPMSADQYSNFLAAVANRRTMEGRLDAQISKLGNTAPEILRNWGTRSTAINNYLANWQEFTKEGMPGQPGNDMINMVEAKYKLAPTSELRQGPILQYLATAMGAMNKLAPLFTGQGGLQESEYNTIISQIKAARADLFVQTNGKEDPVSSQINQYFDNVMTPYMEATQPLYDKAAKLQAAGKVFEADAQYAKIDRIKAQYNHPANGFPSPDEFFYGEKNKRQQALARLTWTTQPISWLSGWQRKLIGYHNFPKEDEMWAQMNKLQLGFEKFTSGMSSSSKLYKANKAALEQQQQALADSFGKPGHEAWLANNAPPFARLWDNHFGTSKYWNDIFPGAQRVAQNVADAGESDPYGFSKIGVANHQAFADYFFSRLNSDTAAGAALRHDWEQLTLSATPQGKNKDRPSGMLLFEEIFFGHYNPDYIPSEIKEYRPKISKVS